MPEIITHNHLLSQSHQTLDDKSQMKITEKIKEGEDYRANSLDPSNSNVVIHSKRIPSSISTTSLEYKGKDLTKLGAQFNKATYKKPSTTDVSKLKDSGVMENHLII
ncbi:hypothetical protein DFH28DRAFT_174429 [Melampsora americana]|nr:hypothetical protein DFH28DRAFT_174429 [Melampsora americana]